MGIQIKCREPIRTSIFLSFLVTRTETRYSETEQQSYLFAAKIQAHRARSPLQRGSEQTTTTQWIKTTQRQRRCGNLVRNTRSKRFSGDGDIFETLSGATTRLTRSEATSFSLAEYEVERCLNQKKRTVAWERAREGERNPLSSVVNNASGNGVTGRPEVASTWNAFSTQQRRKHAL